MKRNIDFITAFLDQQPFNIESFFFDIQHSNTKCKKKKPTTILASKKKLKCPMQEKAFEAKQVVLNFKWQKRSMICFGWHSTDLEDSFSHSLISV